MCNLASISQKEVEDIEAEGDDEVELLYDWLDTLLLKFELDSKVYSKFHVTLLKTASNTLQLRAKAYGETYNRQLHGSKVEVKAVTFHRMEVVREGTLVILRFILDL